MRQDSVLLAFGSYPWICENVARAACTLWSRGSWLGGALVSALCFCCSLAHRFLYGIVVVFLFCCLLYRCHTNPLVIQCYHLSCTMQMPMNWSADHRPCVLFCGFCFGLFCLFGFWCGLLCFCFRCLLFCIARWQLNGLCIDPIQFSFVCTLSTGLMLPQI